MSDYVMHRVTNAEHLLTQLVQLNEAEERFLSTCIHWLKCRNTTIAKLKSLADDLDKHHKNVNIATLSATSVSALGGVAIIGGLLLAPVTAGISAILAIGVGTTACTLGGVTAIGSTLVELGITQQRCKEIQTYLDEDNDNTERLIREMDAFLELSDKLDLLITTRFTDIDLLEIARQINYMAQIVTFGKHTLHTICKFIKKVKTTMNKYEVQKVYQQLTNMLKFCGFPDMKTVAFQMIEKLKLNKVANLTKKEMLCFVKRLFTSPAKLPRTVKVVIGSFTAILVVVDIWSIVKTSIDIHHGSKSKMGNKVREIIVNFEDVRNIINEIIQDWVH